MTLLIRNGRVVDPSQGIDETLDVLIRDGKIVAVGTSAEIAKLVHLHFGRALVLSST